jgi:hypothetical protein
MGEGRKGPSTPTPSKLWVTQGEVTTATCALQPRSHFLPKAGSITDQERSCPTPAICAQDWEGRVVRNPLKSLLQPMRWLDFHPNLQIRKLRPK